MLLLQPLRMSFSTIWSSWKQKYSKFSEVLLLKTGKKRFLVWTGQKFVILHGGISYSGRRISEKLKFRKTIRRLSDLRGLAVFRTCAGLVGPRLQDKEMIKKMVVRSSTTSTKMIRSDLFLISVDVSTSAKTSYQ